MVRRNLKLLLVMIVIAPVAMMFVACGEDNDDYFWPKFDTINKFLKENDFSITYVEGDKVTKVTRLSGVYYYNDDIVETFDLFMELIYGSGLYGYYHPNLADAGMYYVLHGVGSVLDGQRHADWVKYGITSWGEKGEIRGYMHFDKETGMGFLIQDMDGEVKFEVTEFK